MSHKTPRILFILQLPPPLHGASMMNNCVANSKIIRASFEIEIVNLQFARSVSELEHFSLIKVFRAMTYGLMIAGKIVARNPDLVYFTLSPKGYAFYRDAIYVFLLKIMNRKIAFHLHSQGVRINANSNRLKKYLYRKVFRNTYVICLSESLAGDISDVYSPTPFFVPNGIGLYPESNGNIKHQDNAVPHILFLSNYMRCKGILDLIDALSVLKNQGFTFTARLVGAPFDLTVETLESILRKNHLEEFVKVTGPLFGDQKIVEFQTADIFVFPTLNDAFPLVILEAMQFGLPVISTYVGGIPEIVTDNETGFLIDGGDIKLLADKIALLLKDKNMRIEMGKKGSSRFSQNYTLDKFEFNMLNTFQSILDIKRI